PDRGRGWKTYETVRGHAARPRAAEPAVTFRIAFARIDVVEVIPYPQQVPLRACGKMGEQSIVSVFTRALDVTRRLIRFNRHELPAGTARPAQITFPAVAHRPRNRPALERHRAHGRLHDVQMARIRNA